MRSFILSAVAATMIPALLWVFLGDLSRASAIKAFLETLDAMGALKLFGTLGGTAFVIAVTHWAVDRLRWRHYKAGVHRWLDVLIEAQKQHPKQLEDVEWQAECERMLVDAGFRPVEIVQLMGTAVIVAKAIAANRVVM